MSHDNYMKIALRLARRGLGNVAPNPAVGCVIVKNDAIIGRGWTAPSGRPHAETIAIKNAGEQVSGATAYVTLEPCSHHGKTLPCAQSLIDAGIAQVIIATTDPNPLVSGKGIKMLRDANIEVIEDICKDEADEINAGFFLNIKENRPLVTLKLALTSDGKISTPEGQDPKITSDIAHRFAHILRKENDAIMVGIGTVLADNPTLTCRLSGLENSSPIRVVIDSNLRTPMDSNIVQGNTKTLIFSNKTSTDYKENVEVIQQDKIDLLKILNGLKERGITRLLVEGGAKIATSMLENKLVDEIIITESPTIKGDKNAVNMLDIISLDNFSKTETRNLGTDSLNIYRKL